MVFPKDEKIESKQEVRDKDKSKEREIIIMIK